MVSMSQTTSHLFSQPFVNFDNSPVPVDLEAAKYRESKSLISKHSHLLACILEWLEDDSHSVWLGPALKDDSDELMGVAVVLHSNKEEGYAVYLTYEEFRQVYSAVPSMSDYSSIQECDEIFRIPHIEVDDQGLCKALGFDPHKHFDFELCAPLLDPSSGLISALSYAVSGRGEATLQKVSAERKEELELIGTPLEQVTLYFVILFYQSQEIIGGARPGFGNYFYMRGE